MTRLNQVRRYDPCIASPSRSSRVYVLNSREHSKRSATRCFVLISGVFWRLAPPMWHCLFWLAVIVFAFSERRTCEDHVQLVFHPKPTGRNNYILLFGIINGQSFICTVTFFFFMWFRENLVQLSVVTSLWDWVHGSLMSVNGTFFPNYSNENLGLNV